MLPEGCTLADWPLDYAELEPYYDLAERVAGVAGDRDANPFVPRTTDYPMPPLRPFRKGDLFDQAAARELGLHPYPTPVCVNSVPYNGLPGHPLPPVERRVRPFHDDRWNPGLTSVPQALASGTLDLRTHSRVLRLLTDRDGHADGVEYLDPLGEVRTFRARTVILAGLHVRERPAADALRRARRVLRPAGPPLHVQACGPTSTATCPASRSTPTPARPRRCATLDDFDAAGFDSVAHGFVGGASLNVENQQLPLQIARDPLPPGVRSWGRGYQEHIRLLARDRGRPDPARLRCRTGPTTSTSTRGTATAAGSGCRSCA